MVKRFILSLIVLCMILAVVPTMVFADYTDGIYGDYRITKTDGTNLNAGDVVIEGYYIVFKKGGNYKITKKPDFKKMYNEYKEEYTLNTLKIETDSDITLTLSYLTLNTNIEMCDDDGTEPFYMSMPAITIDTTQKYNVNLILEGYVHVIGGGAVVMKNNDAQLVIDCAKSHEEHSGHSCFFECGSLHTDGVVFESKNGDDGDGAETLDQVPTAGQNGYDLKNILIRGGHIGGDKRGNAAKSLAKVGDGGEGGVGVIEDDESLKPWVISESAENGRGGNISNIEISGGIICVEKTLLVPGNGGVHYLESKEKKYDKPDGETGSVCAVVITGGEVRCGLEMEM